jgi:hypothetical protein
MARMAAAGLALLALVGAGAAVAAERGDAPSGKGTTEGVDAEMLRDLDLLESVDHAREREVARRMPFLERLRLLDSVPDSPSWPGREAGPAPARAPR